MRYLLPLICLLLPIASCDRPECHSDNPTFTRHARNTKEYREELLQQLSKQPAGSLRYWIDQYIEKDGRTYMSIFIQGDALCAEGVMDITWIKLRSWG